MASSGYLDDAAEASNVGGPSALIAHLQRENASYTHRISSEEQHVDSIDSEEEDDDGVSFTTWDSEEEARQAQEEWDESVRQLQLAVQVMFLPFLGKWLGRKWSYWIFARFKIHGFSSAFLGIDWIWSPNTIVSSAAVAAVQP